MNLRCLMHHMKEQNGFAVWLDLSAEIAVADLQLFAEIRDVWNLTQQQRGRVVSLRELTRQTL